MKCHVCGSEGSEGKKFCGDCGALLPQSKPTKNLKFRLMSRNQGKEHPIWRIVLPVTVVLLVVFSIVGVIFTQPLSIIRVSVYNQGLYDLDVVVYVDGKEMARLIVRNHQGGIVGEWSVVQGSHHVAIDRYYEPNYYGPDGVYDYSNTYRVGPLYTKDVYFYISI